MKNIPLVSICILTYNHVNYIANGIESVLSQDYENFEIIIGDDASSDGTQEVLKKYKEKYPDKITLILHEKNLGITNNCNSVAKLCKGKYFVAIGGDDQMLPEKLSTQVNYLENNKDCGLCYHNMEAFDLETNEILYYTHLDSNGKRKRDNGSAKEAIREGVFFSPVSAMIRTKDFPDGLYNERIPWASDWLFYVEVMIKSGGTIEYIDSILGRYGRSENNITIKNRAFDFTLDLDMLDSCNILLTKYPKFHKDIAYRYSELLRGMRIKDKKHYFTWLNTSFKISFNLKSLILLSIYFLSLGKVKI